MKPIVPIFYYPLKAMFIDDNVELLKAYHHIDLPNKIITESDPEKAVQEAMSHLPVIQLEGSLSPSQD